MAWKYDPRNNLPCDYENDLYILKIGHSRDQFEYQIRKIASDEFVFRFYAQPRSNSTRDLTEFEKSENPGYDYMGTYLIKKGDLSDEQISITTEALAAYANDMDGFACYVRGVGKRTLIQTEIIERLNYP